MSEKISDKCLIKKIEVLKRSATQHRNNDRPGQRRYWMYPYLRDVYEVFLELHSKDAAERTARRIVKLLNLQIRRKSHLLRVLIEATAGAEDNRAKIKWTSALRYAHGWLLPPERLEWFFDVNEGIAGCANKQAINGGTSRKRAKTGSSGQFDPQGAAQSPSSEPKKLKYLPMDPIVQEGCDLRQINELWGSS